MEDTELAGVLSRSAERARVEIAAVGEAWQAGEISAEECAERQLIARAEYRNVKRAVWALDAALESQRAG